MVLPYERHLAAVCQNRSQVFTHFRPGVRCLTGRQWRSAALAALACLVPVRVGALELAGRAVDTSGTPIAGAQVELQRVVPFYERSLQILQGVEGWDAAATVRTSRDGEFRLAVPEGGMWQVEISAAGRVPVRCRLVPLLEDETLPDAVLETDAGLEVRIEDGEGSPLAGAQVWIRPVRAERRRFRRPSPSPWKGAGRYGRTGEDGRVRLARQKGQKVRVHAFVSGFLPAESDELDTANTTLRLRAGNPVTVQVRAASGEPVSKAVVTMSSLNWVAASTDESGEAVLFVEPDQPSRLTLRRVTGQIESTELLVAARDLAGEQKTRVVREWRLSAPVELAGRVVDEDTREAVGGALVWSSSDIGGFHVTGTDGRYRLERGSADRWFLQAEAPGYGVATIEALRRPGGPRVPTLALARTGALAGRVVDPQGEAIADAVLRVTTRDQIMTARSDADGAFRLTGLTARRSYELATEAPGFAPDYRRLTLEPGRDLEIVLHPGSALIGRLVTPDQEPVVGGRVYLVPVEADPRMRTFSSRTERPPQTESNAEGRFRLEELPRRLMALVARGDGFADKIVRDVDLTDGETQRDLGDIELAWGVELRGLVRSRGGQPIADAELIIFGDASDPVLMGVQFEEDGRKRVTTDAQGRFAVGGLTENRRYNASVQHRDYVDKWVPEIDPGAAQPFEIVLNRAARVSGRVVDDAGAPVERVSVSVRTLAPEEPVTGAMRFGGEMTGGISGADGSFEVMGVSPGRLEVSVTRGWGWIARAPLAVTVAAGEERRDLVLRVTAGSELTGTVTDGEGRPVVGATIQIDGRLSVSSLAMMRGTVGIRSEGRTDGDGTFAVRGLDPATAEVLVSVRHPDFARLEQTFEIRPGRNRLDLVLHRGAAISGVVVTESGEPVEGAHIGIQGASSWAATVVMAESQMAVSGRDGSFEIRGLGSGVYQLQARKPGFAVSAAQSVETSDSPAANVILTLHRGGTIRGRILGLEPDELAQVQVMATDQKAAAAGLVGDDAEYRIPNVDFSDGQVMASSRQRGQVVFEKFTLDTRGGETWVDLEFAAGSSLTGVVLLNGEPVVQAQIMVIGGSGGVGSSSTDTTGRFRIVGLEDGAYQVLVATLNHTEPVSVVGDTEITIEISNVRLSGRVIAEDGREALAGAQVSAVVENDLMSFLPGAQAEATIGGEFELYVPAGRSVLLRAKAPGYAEGSLRVDTLPGIEISGIELALRPGAGLELDVALWTGVRPDLVSAALVDAAGNRVLADALVGRPAGRFRLSSAPRGDWTLLVAAEQSAVVARAVTVPGPRVDVVLPQGATVSVEILNPGSENAAGMVRLVSPAAGVLRFPAFGHVLSEIPVFGSWTEIPFVPAGDWVVELIDAAGRVRSQAVTTVPGETARVSFE